MQYYNITAREDLSHVAKEIVKSMSSVPSAFLLLSGDLGSGKTTLTQEIAKELGVQEAVQSPTYSLLKSYTIPGKDSEDMLLHHLDLYRVESSHELEAAGIIDLMSEGKGYFIVEWPRHLDSILPFAKLVITCELALDAQGTRSLVRS